MDERKASEFLTCSFIVKVKRRYWISHGSVFPGKRIHVLLCLPKQAFGCHGLFNEWKNRFKTIKHKKNIPAVIISLAVWNIYIKANFSTIKMI